MPIEKAEFGFIDPIESAPDVVRYAGEAWECGCGGLKLAPVEAAADSDDWAVSLINWCPHCDAQLETIFRKRPA